MKIATLMNKKSRELYTHQRISASIKRLSPSTDVEIFDTQRTDLDEALFSFKPDLILTYYGGSRGLSDSNYRYKELLKCKIVRIATEPILQADNPIILERNLGFDEYGPKLYDYELVWGRKAKEAFAPVLVSAEKLVDSSRMKYFGHPGFEKYETPVNVAALPKEVLSPIRGIPKKNILLFATGFPYAYYTEEDLIRARDLFDPEDSSAKNQNLQLEALEAVRKSRLARDAWIEMVANVATAFPDLVLLLKTHPLENTIFSLGVKNPFKEALGTLSNVTCIDQDIHIGDLLGLCGLFFHYGSTSNVEAYLRRVPSVLTQCPEIFQSGIPSRFVIDGTEITPSNFKLHNTDVIQFVEKHIASATPFIANPKTERLLEDCFDYHPQLPYRPADKIAAFLLSIVEEPTLYPGCEDPHRIAALRRELPNILKFHADSLVECVKAGNARTALEHSEKVMGLCREIDCAIEHINYLNGFAHAMNGHIVQAKTALRAELQQNPQHEHALTLLSELEGN